MNPTYNIRDDEGNMIEIGDIKGSKPNVLPPERRGEKTLIASLRTDDI